MGTVLGYTKEKMDQLLGKKVGSDPTVVNHTSASLAPAGVSNGQVNLGLAYRIDKLTTTKPCWLRLYATEAHRTKDANRVRTADPTGDDGIIGEYIFLADVLSVTKAVHGYTPGGPTYYTLVNDGTNGTIDFAFTEQLMET